MQSANSPVSPRQHDPWNKGRLIGQKRPLKPKDVWTIRVRLQLEGHKRDLAMFNLGIDSKLRGCDLVRLQVDDICVGGRVRERATVVQKKTGRPVQFELTEQTRTSVQEWLTQRGAIRGEYLFPSRVQKRPHISTRQYARIMLASFMSGSRVPASTVRPTAHIPCDGQRLPRSTRRQATLGLSSFFSAIQSSKAPFAISVSRLTTH